jgi:hypothetical protein
MSEAQVAPVAEVVEQPKQAGSIVTSENLAEFNADKLGLASEESPTAATVEETPVEPAAQEGQSEPKLADDEATGTEEKKQNPKLEKRFSELTKQRKEAEARAEEAERRLAAIEGKQAQPAQAQPESVQKPTPDNYRDAFEYAEALSQWSAEQALLKREQEVKQKEFEVKKQKVIQTWQQKLETTIAELPDYEDMVASSNVKVNDTVRDAILESEVGPRILYELASDDDIAEKLSTMSTASALKLIGKLEAKFEKTEEPVKAEKKTVAAKSKAPEPIRPLRSTGGVADVGMDGNDMSYQQWKAARQAGKIR